MVKSVPYKAEHREGILSLLNDVPFKHRIWDWQFEDLAVCDRFDPVVLVDDDSERVLAFNGVMPAPLWYENEWVQGLWSCDFYVASECRGQGLGRRTKEVLLDKAPVIMSFGVSPKAAAVLEHMGWRLSPEAYSYRMQRRVRSIRDLALKLIQGVNRLRSLKPQPSYQGTLVWSNELPPSQELDELWTRVATGYRKIVRRDAAYMDWKYQRHPLANYRFLVARSLESGLDAVMVVRAHNGGIRIVDWLGPATSPSLKYAMITEVRGHYPEARQITATTTDQELGEALCAAGFFRARTRPSFYIRSSIPGDQNFMHGWFLMTGDSDGELLLAAKDNYGDE